MFLALQHSMCVPGNSFVFCPTISAFNLAGGKLKRQQHGRTVPLFRARVSSAFPTPVKQNKT